MSATMKSLGLDLLSRAERILLVEELLDSIATDGQSIELTNAQRADLKERLDVYRDNPKAGAPWEIVRDRLRTVDTSRNPRGWQNQN